MADGEEAKTERSSSNCLFTIRRPPTTVHVLSLPPRTSFRTEVKI
jgi:hypothetical protein